jgi:hypothetical protein
MVYVLRKFRSSRAEGVGFVEHAVSEERGASKPAPFAEKREERGTRKVGNDGSLEP